jgi:hypothetical protein
MVIQDSPAMFVVYATGIGLTIAGLYLWWSSSGPRRIEVDRGPSILKALAVGALVLGVAFSAVILLAIVGFAILRGPTAS